MKYLHLCCIYSFLVLAVFVIKPIFAYDLRDLNVGDNIKNVPDTRYTKFACLDKENIKSWTEFKNCKKNSNNYYVISFEYDERYALNENFEGTQVSGHPVLINVAIDDDGILQEININTDPKAPFYFRKQAYLMWLRIYYKYGGSDWDCNTLEQKKEHIKIGKKYINKICTKTVDYKKLKLHYQFYFNGDKSKKENLVSKTFLQIKYNNL